MPRKPAKPEIWATGPFQLTLKAFTRARKLSRDYPLSVISAPTGRGKSFAAWHFCQGCAEAVLVELPAREVLTPRILLEVIGAELGIEFPPNLRKYDCARVLIDAIEHRNAFVIIDQAEHLSTRLADVIRWIAEESGLQICLLGAPALEQVLCRDEALARRVGARFRIPPITLADLELIIPRTFPADALEAIIVETRGSLGRVEVLIKDLRQLKASHPDKVLTPKRVAAVARGFTLQPNLSPLTDAERQELGITAA
jgi:DNA transposition AAA+ family ATPase